MHANTIMQICLESGLSIRLGDAGTLLVTPAAGITPEIRALIREHKDELVQELCLPTQSHFDDRITCTTCRNLATGNNCRAHRLAGLTSGGVAADFASLKQRCSGFAALAQAVHREAGVAHP